MVTPSGRNLRRTLACVPRAGTLLVVWSLVCWLAASGARAQTTAANPFVPPSAAPPPAGSGDNQDGDLPDCWNGQDDKNCDCDCSCPTNKGPNPVDVARGNVKRNVRDLEVFGGVGEHQLHWTRYGHSRTPMGLNWFGDGHNWRHSYQWEMVGVGYNLQLTYPDGTVCYYTPNNGWKSFSDNPDLLTQDGGNFYLQRANGFTYHFVQQTSGGGQVSYQLQNFTDSTGNNYTLTYDASNRLALVSEPAGRWLRVTYQDVPVNQDQWTSFYAQTGTPAAGWTEVTVNNPTAFRYLRYFSTEAGASPSFCNVAEVEFYDTAGHKLTGTPFGSSPAWNNGSATFDKVFDGSTGTFFDYQSAHFGFAGLDLGAGNAKAVGKIRFYPRAGWEARMDGTNYEGHPPGCRFEGANVAPVTEAVIAKVEAGYGNGTSQTVTRTVQYNYTTMADPVLTGSSWLTLSGATYGDGSRAYYTYQSLYAGQKPLLYSADDPRVEGGSATRIVYEFWRAQAGVLGSIYAERDHGTNQVLAKFEAGAGGTGTRKVTYANGGVERVTLASNSRASTSTDAMGHQTSYAYTAGGSGFLQGVTDPLGHTTSYTLDAQGRRLSATYADNASESWTRDALGHVLTHKNERGYTTTWMRDTSGRPTRIDYPDGGYETFTYNGFGQVLTHRQTNGGTESFAYDGRGLKTGWTDALSHTVTYGYDAQDLITIVTDPLSHTTNYAYNERGQVTQTTYADNTSASWSYDVYGNQIVSTNELGKTWSATYDAYKRRITANDPLDRQTQYWYDEAGGGGCGGCNGGVGGTSNHPTTIILPSGKTTKIGYDLAWQKTSETAGYNTPAAATTTYTYDTGGNVRSITDPRGKVTTYMCDNRNRPTSVTDPLGHVTAMTYDLAGNMLTETRADNTVLSRLYDPINRCTQVTDTLNQVTKAAYDAAGNLVMVTDARNNANGFAYDLRNRKTQMSYADGSHEDWSYDAAGNLAAYRTRAGQVRAFSYDARNRATDAAWNDAATPEVTASYDAAGRVLTLNNANSALSYAYDDAGQLASESQNPTNGPGAKTTAYAYDADGNRAQLTNPDGTAITYAYTTRNQLSSVSLSGPPPLATYTYDLAGNPTGKSLENGTTAAYVYDDASRPISLVHQGSGTTLASFAYAYNAVDNLTSVTREGGLGDVYTRDAAQQLTGAQYAATDPAGTPSNPQSVQGFSYDAAGNRTGATQSGAAATTYTANALNAYIQVGAAAPGYDANGNLGTLGNASFGYDAQNRLTSAVVSGNPSAGLATDYDAWNRPVRRVTNGQPRFLYYDGWNLVAEYGAGGSGGVEVASYVDGPGTDEVLARVDGASGAVAYYHADRLGSVSLLTDHNARVVERYHYDAYGRPTIQTAAGAVINESAYGNRFLFTGREWLASAGLYDYRQRVYSPGLGRFLQTDPIRLEGGIDLYAYVQNCPVDWTDPFGLLSPVYPSPWYPPMRLPDLPPGFFVTRGGRLIFPTPDRKTNCFGQTFLPGWNMSISGSEAEKIAHDDCTPVLGPVDKPQGGDKGMYHNPGGEPVHAAPVTGDGTTVGQTHMPPSGRDRSPDSPPDPIYPSNPPIGTGADGILPSGGPSSNYGPPIVYRPR